MVWVVAGPQSTSGESLTLHGLCSALAAAGQQQQPGFVCPGLYCTCTQSAQRSSCVSSVMWAGEGGAVLLRFDCSFMRVMLSMSHRASCARLYVRFESFLHCVSAPWSIRVAVLLGHFLPGWLAASSTSAAVH